MQPEVNYINEFYAVANLEKDGIKSFSTITEINDKIPTAS
jgi:hypothetical protein